MATVASGGGISAEMVTYMRDFIPMFRCRERDIPYSDNLSTEHVLRESSCENPVFLILINGHFHSMDDVIQQIGGVTPRQQAENALARARQLSRQGRVDVMIHPTSLGEVEAFRARFSFAVKTNH